MPDVQTKHITPNRNKNLCFINISIGYERKIKKNKKKQKVSSHRIRHLLFARAYMEFFFFHLSAICKDFALIYLRMNGLQACRYSLQIVFRKVSARNGNGMDKEQPSFLPFPPNIANMLVHSSEHFVQPYWNTLLYTVETKCSNVSEQSVSYGVTKCFMRENTLFCVAKQNVTCGKTLRKTSPYEAKTSPLRCKTLPLHCKRLTFFSVHPTFGVI